MSREVLIDIWVIHLATVGQTVFLVLWLSLPWWRAWVGRALMVKSFALWLLLTAAVVSYWVDKSHGPYVGESIVILSTHIAVLIGVWSQVAALGIERHAASKANESVTGTVKRTHDHD